MGEHIYIYIHIYIHTHTYTYNFPLLTTSKRSSGFGVRFLLPLVRAAMHRQSAWGRVLVDLTLGGFDRVVIEPLIPES